jgi:FkbM family methyltransferase
MKEQAFSQLLSKLDIHPVLIDVGSSGATPEIWEGIARHSVFVGFDPDLREIYETREGHFHQAITINEAITSDPASTEVQLYLTKFAYCSSTLRPDFDSLSNFLFADLFTVEREERVRAATLDAVLSRLSLSGIDWLKLDTQGTDLRIFQGLREETRLRVLAIDIEPGLIDAYRGEDLFADAHKELVREGFWLSNLNVGGAVRMRAATLEAVTSKAPDINRAFVESHLKKSPGWCEARYLRTIAHLGAQGSERRDYVLLWVFALLDEQLGFALDLAVEYEKVFGGDEVSQSMREQTISRIRRARALQSGHRPAALARVKSLVPPRAKQWLKKLIK